MSSRLNSGPDRPPSDDRAHNIEIYELDSSGHGKGASPQEMYAASIASNNRTALMNNG
jgi:hypothetical protein